MRRLLPLALLLICGNAFAQAAPIFQAARNGVVTFPSGWQQTNPARVSIPPEAGGTYVLDPANDKVAWEAANDVDIPVGLAEPAEVSIVGEIEISAEAVGADGAAWCFAAPEVCAASVVGAAVLGYMAKDVFLQGIQWMHVQPTAGYGTCSGPGSNISNVTEAACAASLLANGYPGHTDTGWVDQGGTVVLQGVSPQPGNGCDCIAAGYWTQTGQAQSIIVPAQPSDWQQAYEDDVPPAVQPQLAQALQTAGQPVDAPPDSQASLTASPTSQSIDGGTQTTTLPNGTTSTTTSQEAVTMGCSGNTVASANCAPSVVTTSTTTDPNGTTTTTTNDPANPPATQQCGLAGQSPCEVSLVDNTDAPTLPSAATFAQTTESFMARVQASPLVSAFAGLHISEGGTCPTYNYNISYTAGVAGSFNGTLDAQCTIAEDIRTPLGIIMLAVFSIWGVTLFLKA